MAQSSENNYSSDDMVPRKKVKLEDDNPGPSSTAQEESMRPAVNKFKKLHVKLRKNDQGYQRFDTDGKETILEMVKRMIEIKAKRKPNIHGLLFQSFSDHSFINIGLATGALSEKEWYICSFRKKRFSDMIRLYDVEDFDESWNLSSFIVKFESNMHFLISDMQRIVEILKVNFFPGENLFEALYRDGRFLYTEAIHNSDFEAENKARVYLTSEATSDTFTITKRRIPNTQTKKLAENGIQPLRKPGGVVAAGTEISLKGNTVILKTESNSNASLITTSTNSGHQTSSSGLNSPGIQFTCNKDLEDFLKEHFDIEVQKQAKTKIEKKRISNIKNLFSKNYNHFALTRKNVRLASEMKDFTKMFDSVGAVVVEPDSGQGIFMGTCFVIGSQYVITNRHVMDDIDITLKKTGAKDFYVDFEYQDSCNGHKFRFLHETVVDSPVKSPVSSALDYAILKLREPESTPLPPSLTKCGYVIPSIDRYIVAGEWLTLIGYPQDANGKVMEDACPLKPLLNLDENMVIALNQLKPDDQKVLADQRRQTYDTFAFFHGSSGSPGVLMNEKLLVVLHCRGFYLQDGRHSIIEQGVRMSAVRDDVDEQIKNLPGYTLNELFDIPLNPKEEEPMEIDPHIFQDSLS